MGRLDQYLSEAGERLKEVPSNVLSVLKAPDVLALGAILVAGTAFLEEEKYQRGVLPEILQAKLSELDPHSACESGVDEAKDDAFRLNASLEIREESITLKQRISEELGIDLSLDWDDANLHTCKIKEAEVTEFCGRDTSFTMGVSPDGQLYINTASERNENEAFRRDTFRHELAHWVATDKWMPLGMKEYIADWSADKVANGYIPMHLQWRIFFDDILTDERDFEREALAYHFTGERVEGIDFSSIYLTKDEAKIINMYTQNASIKEYWQFWVKMYQDPEWKPRIDEILAQMDKEHPEAKVVEMWKMVINEECIGGDDSFLRTEDVSFLDRHPISFIFFILTGIYGAVIREKLLNLLKKKKGEEFEG